MIGGEVSCWSGNWGGEEPMYSLGKSNDLKGRV